MTSRIKILPALACPAIALLMAAAPSPTQAAPVLRTVPTFENCGVYLEGAEGVAPAEVKVTYRQAGSEAWLEGHALTNSADDPVPRGSIFGLTENSAYEVRAVSTAGQTLAQTTVTTWSEKVPIAKTINLKEVNPSGGPFLIDESGTAEGWVRYLGSPGYVVDGKELDEEALLIENAKYVIVENLTVRGGQRHGIQIRNSQDIRIHNCDIAGYGRVGVQDLARKGQFYLPGETKSINWDAGVYLDLAGRTVIEQCYIHDPRGRANSWFYSHPAGPNAIFVRSTGEVVVRYNDLVGSESHRWNDVIESYGNGKIDGGFYKDSDIYGNFLAFPNDDCIELDGGQRNVRFYNNKLEGGLCGISTAPNVNGPSYLINNLVVNLGDERGIGSAGVKNGGGDTSSKGTTYFYHNVFHTFGRGITGVGFGNDKNREMFLGISRNNILAVSADGISDPWAPPVCDYDYDLFTTAFGGKGGYGVARAVEANGILDDARFVSAATGDFALKPGSPALGSGQLVPGLSSWESAAKVDRGLAPVKGGAFVMPRRPGGLSADKYQLMLTQTGDAPAQAQFTVTAGALPAPCKFRVLKNETADWLQVTPSEGSLEAGASLAFNTSMAAGKAKSGLLLGALIVKLETGESLPITVYGRYSPARIRLALEAETADGAQDLPVDTNQEASGHKFVKLVDEQSGKTGKGAKLLTFKPEIPKAGDYFLYARVLCPPPGGLHDSMFLSINGTAPSNCALPGRPTWTWAALSTGGSFLSLKAGANEIKLIPREEVWVDSIYLSDSPFFPGDEMPRGD